ncbi:5-hydroxytryptamine receptor 1F isoform X2 [Melanerpes formicivorus]|uniref:5-hydroxytryptamine receptor 1F isoform X2 n=1 Tax=Melanerpes formicivorus TaxID=211600 RepID=UPI00358F0D21
MEHLGTLLLQAKTRFLAVSCVARGDSIHTSSPIPRIPGTESDFPRLFQMWQMNPFCRGRTHQCIDFALPTDTSKTSYLSKLSR